VRRDVSASEVPTQDINFVEISRRPVSSGPVCTVNRPTSAFGGRSLLELHKAPVRPSLSSPGPANSEIRNGLLRLDTPLDVEGLQNLMGETATQEGWIFPAEFVDSPMVILDACRWSARDCPAAALKRLFVRRDATVAPCFRHPGVSTSRLASRQDLAHTFEAETAAAAIRRNCDRCPASSSCSRCFVVEDFGDAYCELKRGNPSLTVFVDALLAIHVNRHGIRTPFSG
jgi:hypothetical protein